MFKIKIRIFVLPVLLISFAIVSCRHTKDNDYAEIKLATWNVRILSNGSRDDNELSQIAEVIKRYDLVAIQEARVCPGYSSSMFSLTDTKINKIMEVS